jgi:tetratricopeptide (TPR) repeat protein
MTHSNPFQILDPNERWAPDQKQLDSVQNEYEKLLPPLVYKVRKAVAEWRDKGYEGASETTRHLLFQFWFSEEHPGGFRFYFSQREAIESIAWLHEVARAHDRFDLLRYDSSGRISTGMFEENWTRYLVKMATGAGEGTTLNNISQIHDARGDYDTALDYLRQSLKIRQEIGDRAGEGTTLNNIGQIHDARGDYDTALDYLRQSLKICQEIGDRAGEGTTLNNISQIHKARGDYDTALDYLRQSLKIRQEIGDRAGMCPTLHNMAFIYLNQKNDVEEFVKHEQAALQIALEIGNVQGIFEIGRVFGSFLCENGAAELGLQNLTLALQAGQRAGFPGTEQVAEAIQYFSTKK